MGSRTMRDPGETSGLEPSRESVSSTAIADACTFLERAQCADGRWLDFRGDRNISSSWVTAYIGTQLARAASHSSSVDRARTWLLDHPHPAGGWGYNRATRPDADTIANVVHFLLALGPTEATARAITASVRLLEQFFVPSVGGFRTYQPVQNDSLHHPNSSWCAVHPCVTAMCASALAAADYQGQSARVRMCADYLRSQQRETGLVDAFWWEGATYATYHAARVLRIVGDGEAVARAKEGVLARVHCDGGWGTNLGGASSAFHTALAVKTLTIACDDRHTRAIGDGLTWLLRMQEPDGGWPTVPILRVPRPDIHHPRGAADEQWAPTLRDRNRLFTTATVLSALVDGSSAFYATDPGNAAKS